MVIQKNNALDVNNVNIGYYELKTILSVITILLRKTLIIKLINH